MVRSDELLDMTVTGVNVRQRTARVERGKGGKGRVTAFSAQTARDLDRYIRARPRTGWPAEPWLWLPVKRSRRTRLTYDGLYTTLRRRARAGRPPFRLHPHMLRSTGAIEFRRKGGSGDVADGARRLDRHCDGAAVHEGGGERAGDRGGAPAVRRGVITLPWQPCGTVRRASPSARSAPAAS